VSLNVSVQLPLIIAALAFAIWVYLLLGRGEFWRTPKFDDLAPAPGFMAWPSIAVVVPARDEAAGVGDNVRSILSQPYPGNLSLILVDDQSNDGTPEIARAAAAGIGASDRLTVLSGQPLPQGWTGKLWAVKQGLSQVEERATQPDYVLLTDADIVYSGDVLMRLVARAQNEQLAMTSIMAKLRCESFAEKYLIPAFIFFFEMLYPFAWVRNRKRATGAAAGGCILARWDALKNAGGIDAIRGSLIDDCALGMRLKTQGPVWLGFSQDVISIRASDTVTDVGRMISRSAYAQLRYSVAILGGTVTGMVLIYLMPVLIALFGHGLARVFAAVSWLLMALAFQPTLRYYRQSALWGLALPAIAVAYMVFTVNSALQHFQGRGGMWKGRAQAQVSGS
jgi:hopene-associated glycosyltransferase HpnB